MRRRKPSVSPRVLPITDINKSRSPSIPSPSAGISATQASRIRVSVREKKKESDRGWNDSAASAIGSNPPLSRAYSLPVPRNAGCVIRPTFSIYLRRLYHRRCAPRPIYNTTDISATIKGDIFLHFFFRVTSFSPCSRDKFIAVLIMYLCVIFASVGNMYIYTFVRGLFPWLCLFLIGFSPIILVIHFFFK